MALSINKIKQYRLLKNKKQRDKDSLFLAEGIKIVEEAIQFSGGESIHELIVSKDCRIDIPDSLKSKVSIVEYEEIKKISSLKSPQPLIAVLKKPTHQPIDLSQIKDSILVLDQINNPGNMGTIIRLSDWFGISQVVCSENCVDIFNPKTVQATMGSVLRIKVHYLDLEQFITKAKDGKIPVYGATLDGDNIYRTPVNTPSLIVMGNEAEGISPAISNLLNKKLKIPNFSKQSSSGESLNVAMATGIFLSELRRRETF